VIWSDESSFTLFPASGREYIWRTRKEAYNPECLVPTMKHGGGSVMVWTAISWYSILLAPLLPFMTELLQGSTWTGSAIRCIHDPNNDAVFQEENVPIHTAGNVQSWFKEHKDELEYFRCLAQSPDFEHH
jgi:hypothetical protein